MEGVGGRRKRPRAFDRPSPQPIINVLAANMGFGY
jgi:hypothetical protein